MPKPIRITPQELENNYEFKIVKKIIMSEHPWIKSIFVRPDDLNQYSTLFLNFDIDPELLAKTYNFELKGPILTAIKNDKEYNAPFLSLFGDITYEEAIHINSEIIETANQVHESNAIPDELKLHGRTMYGISTWFYNRGKEPWF